LIALFSAKLFEARVKCFHIFEDRATYAREITSRNVQDTFVEIAALRGLTGRLDIKHEAEQMEMKIATTRNGQMREDMASLSGGERSFTTIALLLAIWDRAQTPFHMCDEFDVYLVSKENVIFQLRVQVAEYI
jgi:chromosome segregation ATPase